MAIGEKIADIIFPVERKDSRDMNETFENRRIFLALIILLA